MSQFKTDEEILSMAGVVTGALTEKGSGPVIQT